MTVIHSLDPLTLRCVAAAFDMDENELLRVMQGYARRRYETSGGVAAQCEARTQLGRRCGRDGNRSDRAASWLPVLCEQHWRRFGTEALTWLNDAADDDDAFRVLETLLDEAYRTSAYEDDERKRRRARMRERIEEAVGATHGQNIQRAIQEMWS